MTEAKKPGSKMDITRRYADLTGDSLAKAEGVYNAMARAIVEELHENDVAVLEGLGRLRTTRRAAREGRNPNTGEHLVVAARTAVTLTMSKAAKADFNGSDA